MNVIQEISEWAATLPAWQSDAIRRIFIQNNLRAEDEDEIFEMLRHQHGLTGSEVLKTTPVPFSNGMESSHGVARSVFLKELHSIEHVNALVAGQAMKFAINGITVIYGENGAGKSGYARIFKHACFARDKGDPILTNVTKPARGKPTAVLELLVDNEHTAFRWTLGAPVSSLLSNIAVFDSHCARVFVDQANEVVYLPYGLDVFARLGNLCVSMKAKIAKEIKSIPTTYSGEQDYGQTVAGRFIRMINDTSDETDVDKIGFLDAVQVQRLEQLRILVASSKVNPPKVRAAQLRRTKSRCDQLKDAITKLNMEMSAKALGQIRELQIAVETSQRAVAIASSSTFASDPLQGVGSDPWRQLFASARAYSEQLAYAGQSFPVLEDGSICVLCQQPLADGARDRMKRFDEFVANDSAMRLEAAKHELQKAVTTFGALKVDLLTSDISLVEELRVHSDTLVLNLHNFFVEAAVVHANVLDAISKQSVVPDTAVSQFEFSEFDTLIAALEGQAKEYDQADKPEELAKLIAELKELEDRDRLKKHSSDVKAYIHAKKCEARLKRCEKALDTNGITRYGNEVMDRAVTEQLIANLNQELEFFNVQCAKVQIKKLGDKGKTKHQLTLPNSTKPSGVLSEGEQRIVAIASFLAELATGNSSSPIIFDDPVSSLDHRFRERVASRLVKEASNRQVVVFTHDVVMLLALEQEAAHQQIPLSIQTVSKTPNGPGECMPRPWYACNTNERLGILKSALSEFKKHSKDDLATYEVCIREFYGRLRESWERAIEEVLLQDVVQRFRPSVETQRLKRVAIVPEDYVQIENGMARCSKYLTGHDKSAAIVAPVPSPEEADKDIKLLEDFVAMLRKREKETQKTIKECLAPPKASFADNRASKVIDIDAA